MILDENNQLLCECGYDCMHNITEYILPGSRNREKAIIIITQCESCMQYNSYGFLFHKGSIYFSHFYGEIVENAMSEDGKINALVKTF